MCPLSICCIKGDIVHEKDDNKPFRIESNEVKGGEVVGVVGLFHALDYHRFTLYHHVMKKQRVTLSTNLYTIARSGTSLFSAILVNNKVVLDRVEELQRLGSNYSEGKPHKGRTTKPIDQVHVLTLISVGQYCCIVIVESFSKIPVAYTCLLSASDTAVCNPSTLPASH